MNPDIKIKALAKLAQSDKEAALNTINAELIVVKKCLESEVQYALLERSIEILNAFAHRLAPQSTEIISAFLDRLDSIELTHQEIES